MKSSRRYFDKRKDSSRNRNYASCPIHYIHQFQNIHLEALPHIQTFMVDFFLFFYVLSYFCVINLHLQIHLEFLHFAPFPQVCVQELSLCQIQVFSSSLQSILSWGALFFSGEPLGLVAKFWTPYLGRRLKSVQSLSTIFLNFVH